MVRYYWQNSSPLVFVFDNNGADQYTELWSLGKSGSTYDSILTINYEIGAAAACADPGVARSVGSPSLTTRRPCHGSTTRRTATPRPLPRSNSMTLAGSPSAHRGRWPGRRHRSTCRLRCSRGTTYRWAVRTSNSYGQSLYCAQQSFVVKANPVVTIGATRKMVFSNSAPRLVVEWTTDQPQSQYRVTATGGYSSGIKPGGDQSFTLDTLALVSGTPITVTVEVWNNDTPVLTGSASRAFTPRYGLTTHKKTLLAVPTNWQTPQQAPASQPAGSELVIEYGSSAGAGDAAPTSWLRTLSSVPFTQFLHWRAWFIPSATEGPTLDYLNIPYSSVVAVVDKWKSFGAGSMQPPWYIDPGEYVYGTRSVAVACNGAANYLVSETIKLRAGRSYIISGLMKSDGNSGARYQLFTPGGIGLSNNNGETIETPPIRETRAWHQADQRDVRRYRSPVYEATGDIDVQVWCRVDGASGTKAWFDAVKLEESSVATVWGPGEVGATVVDAGGVQIDGQKGGVLRYRGTTGGVRDVVEGGANGLLFGGDTPLFSPAAGYLQIDKGGGEVLRIGNDAEIFDVDIADALGIRSATNVNAGELRFGGSKSVYARRDPTRGDGWLQIGPHVAVEGVFSISGERMAIGSNAFPAGPWAGVSYYRTDLAMWFIFDGTRWMSQPFLWQVPIRETAAALAGIAATTAAIHRGKVMPGVGLLPGITDIWLESIEFVYLIAGGTALSGSHRWDIFLDKLPVSGGGTGIYSFNVNSGTVSVWRRQTAVLNALLGAGFFQFQRDADQGRHARQLRGRWSHHHLSLRRRLEERDMSMNEVIIVVLAAVALLLGLVDQFRAHGESSTHWSIIALRRRHPVADAGTVNLNVHEAALWAIIAICFVLIGAILTPGTVGIDERGAILAAIAAVLLAVGWRLKRRGDGE